MITAQVFACLIFVVMFILIIMDKIEKHYVTLGCGLLTLVVVFGFSMHSMDAVKESLNLSTFFDVSFWYTGGGGESSSTGINWSTILFLTGMMIMVEGMAKAGFFRWLCMRLAKMVHYRPMSLFFVFMLMSALLSMFIDSITVILFLAAVTVELAQLLGFNPIPMVVSEVFCANLGGSATMCGDPPNIIIGTSLGFTFMDFVTNTGLIVLIALVFVIVYFYLIYGKEFRQAGGAGVDPSKLQDPSEMITDRKSFISSTCIFLLAVVLLITHASTGLTVAFIGLLIASITLAVNHRDAADLLKRVDYQTLLFFVGLFVVVGGLEQTGVLEVIANLIGVISGGNIRLMVAIILWLSAVASAFVDNIPFAATMLPVIQSLAASQGVDMNTIAWALSVGTDVGGSATPIGASANVVGTSVAAKNGYPISWGKYCRAAAPATVLVCLIAMLLIFVRYC